MRASSRGAFGARSPATPVSTRGSASTLTGLKITLSKSGQTGEDGGGEPAEEEEQKTEGMLEDNQKKIEKKRILDS